MNFISDITVGHSSMKYVRMIMNIIYTLLFDIAEKDFNIIPIFILYYTIINEYVLYLYYSEIHTR